MARGQATSCQPSFPLFVIKTNKVNFTFKNAQYDLCVRDAIV